ncbi:MAG: nicotinate-nucleotide--dimethylbenzimidazole phosphoribosyltransferase [Pseudomonadota bacterium]
MAWWESAVASVSHVCIASAESRQACLTKPSGSLGRLERVAIQLAGLQHRDEPTLERVDIRVFAADHGVVEEGVSAFPQSVTAEMIRNFARGGAAISVLARELKADFLVVNLGTVQPLEDLPGVHSRMLAPGTANFCKEPAMTEVLCSAALQAGAEQVRESCHLFIGGEMGIGNTTAAAALVSQLLGVSPDLTVGPGTGVTGATLEGKRAVVERALATHAAACDSPLATLTHLGGLEIAALAGSYVAAAQRAVPVLVDGYIASVAALLACRLNPGVADWLLYSHRSAEPGHRLVLEALQGAPMLDLEMRLGEGSGAATALPLLRLACQLHNEMATFEQAQVSGGDKRMAD